MDKGFTLIEMLLVVAIIGFLVAILVPSVGGWGAEAKENAVRGDLRNLKTALEVYYIAHGAYPPSADVTGGWPKEEECYLLISTLSGYHRTVDKIPDDLYGASAGDDYKYDLYEAAAPGERDTYVVWSMKGNPAGVAAADDSVTNAPTSGLYVTNARK